VPFHVKHSRRRGIHDPPHGASRAAPSFHVKHSSRIRQPLLIGRQCCPKHLEPPRMSTAATNGLVGAHACLDRLEPNHLQPIRPVREQSAGDMRFSDPRARPHEHDPDPG
jgi:hypothetical protein